MAKEFTQNVIGIEITEEYIYLSQINEENQSYKLTNYKKISMPPRSIIEGLIADPEQIADQISNAIDDDNEFNATNIVIALNNTFFLKKTTILTHEPDTDLNVKLENLTIQSPLVQNKECQISFQKFSPNINPEKTESEDSNENETENIQKKDIILYAALNTDLIDNIGDLAKSLDMNLVSIDLAPLGTLRAMQWNTPKNTDITLRLNFDFEYFDINFTYKNHVLLSRTFRNNIEEVLEEDLFVESYISSFKQLFLEFSNLYPNFQIPSNCISFNRNNNINSFLNKLKEELSLSITEYDMKETVSFNNDNLTDEQKDQVKKQFLPSIGLALKYYEPVNKTLSLTKVKKQIAPLFKKEILLKSLTLSTIAIGSILAANIYISNQISSIEKKLKLTQKQITIIQRGDKSGQKKQLGNIRKTIDYYETIRSENDSKYLFFYNLIGILPTDITFSSISYTKNNKVAVKGEAYLKDSIYNFYSSLEKQYKNVKLAKIKTSSKNKSTINEFEIQFE